MSKIDWRILTVPRVVMMQLHQVYPISLSASLTLLAIMELASLRVTVNKIYSAVICPRIPYCIRC